MRAAILVLVVFVFGGCAVSNLHRRSLLIDDLDAYAARGAVTTRLLGSGWCMAESQGANDVYHRCPHDANLWLELSFKGDHLITAVLSVPLPAPASSRVIRAAGGPTRVTVAEDPFHGEPERVLVIDRPLGSVAPSRESPQGVVLDALADEWRARFGAPFRHGAGWYEWRPRPDLRGFVAATNGGVIEAYIFDPSVILDGEVVAQN